MFPDLILAHMNGEAIDQDRFPVQVKTASYLWL